MTHLQIDSSKLLAEAGWLRRLAYSLLRDAGQADDAVQETLAHALASPPRAEAGTRAFRKWLSSTLRGRAANARRGARRRLDWEQMAAQDREEAEPGAAEIVAAAEISKRLVQHVMKLGEADRAVLLLRYFEGESTAAIAERLSASEEAVRTRLCRARRRLAESLDHESGGDRSLWMSALAPLAYGQISAPLLAPFHSAVVSIMSLKSICAVGALVLAVLIALPFLRDGELSTPAAIESAPSASGKVADLRPVLTNPEAATAARAVTEEEAAQEIATTEPWHGWRVTGRAVDRSGAPVAGARVVLHTMAQVQAAALTGDSSIFSVALSGDDGVFTVEAPRLPRREGILEVHASGLARTYRRVSEAEITHPVEPLGTLLRELGDIELGGEWVARGLVQDELGRAIAGAQIRFRGYPGIQYFSQDSWGYFRKRPAAAVSGEDGSFEVRGLSRHTTQLIASHPRYLDSTIAVEVSVDADAKPLPQEPAVLKLRAAAVLSGTVRFPGERPAEDLSLFLAPSHVTIGPTDSHSLHAGIQDDGTFLLESLSPGVEYGVGVWTGLGPAWSAVPRSRLATFVAGEDAGLVIDYIGGASLEFRVTDESGASLEKLSVIASMSGQPYWDILDNAYRPEFHSGVWPGGAVELRGIVSQYADSDLSVSVSAKGYQTHVFDGIRVAGSERIDAGVIALMPVKKSTKKKRDQPAAAKAKASPPPQHTVVVRVGPADDASAPRIRIDSGSIDPRRKKFRTRRSQTVEPGEEAQFTKLGPGTHYFRASAAGDPESASRVFVGKGQENDLYPWTQLDITPTSPERVEVVLDPIPTSAVEGVIQLNGEPAPGAKLYLTQGRLSAGDYLEEVPGARGVHDEEGEWTAPASGAFRFEGVALGPWTLQVRLPGSLFLHEVPIEVLGDGVPLTVNVESTRITGRVVGESGAPLRRALVRVALPKESLSDAYQEIQWQLTNYSISTVLQLGEGDKGRLSGIQTDDDGRFEIEHLPAGHEWRLWIHDAAHASASTEAISLAPGEQRDLREIRLELAATLSVRVEGASSEGQWVQFERLTTSGESDGSHEHSANLRRGRASFPRLFPGRYRVSLMEETEDGENSADTEEVTLVASERTTAEF